MPLLSIVIPTRNRQEYAASCIRSLLRILSVDLEVVVQDNSDADELRRHLDRHAIDERLNYTHRSGRVSVIDNCNDGVSRASGQYVYWQEVTG